jgi:hypothetical protein
MIEISSQFDSGAIEIVGIDGTSADLRIRHDVNADGHPGEFLQWFISAWAAKQAGRGTFERRHHYRGWRISCSATATVAPGGSSTGYGKGYTVELPPAPAACISPISSLFVDVLDLLADSCSAAATAAARRACRA